jgi:predicted permease
MREWIGRLLDWARRDRLSRELAEETRFHRRMLERDAAASGATDAADTARRRFGNDTRIRESARDLWSVPWLDQMQQDVRYAIRGLRRSPGFTITVVLTLALGIGANATMFSVVDQLMFRPLAYLRDPGSLHRIYWQWQDHGRTITTTSSPYTRYLDIARETNSFTQVTPFYEGNVAVGDGEAARERRVAAVSASFFGLFDARPVLGRFFTAAEDVTPRGADVAVLSHGFWLAEFGGRDVIGTRLQVGDTRATIIGVAPPDFNGVNDAIPPSVFIPITTFAGSSATNDAKTYFTRYDWGWANVLVRRKPGVTLEQAGADATAAFRRSWNAARAEDPSIAPLEDAHPRAIVSAVRTTAGPNPGLEARTALWVAVVAGIVLVIAAANVANLFLARGLRRRRETAVRLALGAGRRRLITQSVVESVVVASLGGAAALFVAYWSAAAIRGLLVVRNAPAIRTMPDARVVAFTIVLTLGLGATIGCVPWLSSRLADVASVLRGGGRGATSRRSGLREGLLVLQATLSVVLLVGATLFVRSLAAVRALPMGYDSSHVLMVNRVVRGPAFSDTSLMAMRRSLEDAARALPGVESEAWMSSAPFLSTSSTSIFVPGVDSVRRLGVFRFQATTPDYFRTMGTRILRGRGLSTEDRQGAPMVTVVSESMARALWPSKDPIGQCFRMRTETAPCMTVVGVAEDMVQEGIATDDRYGYYVALDQYTRTHGNWMAIRLRGDPAANAEAIRRALQQAMPGMSYVNVRPLDDVVGDARRSWRLGATMFVSLGLLALVVAAIGLYGVIGYDVTQRLPELGIRRALGARPVHIIAIVVTQNLRLAAVGMAFGLLIAVWAAHWIEPLLFHQSATDPRVYAAVTLTMLLVALGASALPGARAVRVDPTQSLRRE